MADTVRIKIWMVYYGSHTSGPHFNIFAAREANVKLYCGRGSISQGFRVAFLDEQI